MQRIDFDLDREHVELNQLLKLVGIADSGGQGKAIVASGEVTVDGVVELRKTAKIRAGQIVRVGDAEIRVRGVEGLTHPLLGSTPLYSQQASALSLLVGA